MKAASNEQRSILDIQRLDFARATLENKAATLPELDILKKRMISQNNVRDLRIAAETELSDVKRELLRAEGDVEQILTRIERDEKRLSSGTGTPKELEQTQHELGTLGARRAELEEVELEIMMRVDTIKDRIAGLSSEESAFALEMAELEIKKENSLAAIHSELETIAIDRKVLAQSVAADFLGLYEKIREGNNGTGAAVLAGSQCKGCNLTLNTIELQRIGALADDEVVRCEECRCILVRDK